MTKHPFTETLGPGPYKYVGSYDMGAALAHQQSFGDTAAAPELLEALELADAALSGANMNMNVVFKKVKAAIAKAKGE